ncbi:P-loop containing nucleoside triphosphate hydrolase protein [Pseudomassariella vexata]|uniref:p-loop containing nucleoside triphosphate hydrolase protein n=1 Tax=Pseudomassariella vexata TaxID=1141098 RepID=A0A1Y2EF06_9PEZI|nr:P-loop containing nucleoside triphosphate hydrolase protein [Pseudomassariella vexata]ORY70173.1 P-loop containing nucleoside triphosphate hydrolase protein [Pseudomassariella vexata]
MNKPGPKPNPTIRILMLGAAGVGKSALESRFTTGKYPPEYDTSLTLSSRRCITLPCSPCWYAGEVAQTQHASDNFKRLSLHLDLNNPPSSLSLLSRQSTGPPLFNQTLCCAKCERERRNNTFLVEVINYPRVQSPKERLRILMKRDFDAVLLIYDIANRESFETVAYLHNEIILEARKPSSTLLKRMTIPGWVQALGRKAQGEIVVGIVGNKSDIDTSLEYKQSNNRTMRRKLREQEKMIRLGRKLLLGSELEVPLSPSSISGSESMQIPSDASASGSNPSVISSTATSDKSSTLFVRRTQLTGPRQMKRPSRSFKVDSWVQSGSPITESMPEDPEIHQVDATREVGTCDSASWASATTTTARRQVTKKEGQEAARTLLLPVPFFETSAKTGDNVNTMFEVVVREVLRQIGREI